MENAAAKNVTSPAKKSLKLHVEFDFEKKIKFDLEDSKEYDDIFKMATRKYFVTEIETDNITARLVGKKQQNKDLSSHLLIFKIESNSEGVDLTDYKDYFDENNKAKELWKSLKIQLEKAFPKIKISLSQWDNGSIIIKVTILKSSNEEWKEDEINEIEEKMSDFVNKVELTGDLSQCVMSFKSGRKAPKDISPPCKCLVYRLNAFSEDVAQKLDNFDVKKFMGCLQLFLSNLEEEVTVTGKQKNIFLNHYYIA